MSSGDALVASIIAILAVIFLTSFVLDIMKIIEHVKKRRKDSDNSDFA